MEGYEKKESGSLISKTGSYQCQAVNVKKKCDFSTVFQYDDVKKCGVKPFVLKIHSF